MITPGAHFADIARTHARCFWLDGGGAREWSGRRSLIGWLDGDDVSITYDARTRLVTRHCGGRGRVVGDDVFEVLDYEMAEGPGDAQWFGYFGYAARPDLPAEPGDLVPDAVWMRARQVQVFEHELRAGRGSHSSRSTPSPLTDADERAYRDAFDRVQARLRAGDSYEMNLTYRLTAESGLDPVTAYQALRQLNPAPYAGCLQHDVPGARSWLLSSSPERFALVTSDRQIETKPIKGTTPRGTTPEEDAWFRSRLETEPKFRAENLMIVDLLRNDIAMVSQPGTVTVPALMQVESYETVHQLVSTVRGTLRDGLSTVAALKALFPAGSMTGAPKRRTMEVIADVESTPRGAYAGAFGWISADGRADLGVVIRSLVTDGDGRWSVGTGGGITVDSDPGEELAESWWKASRLLAVFGKSGRMEAVR